MFFLKNKSREINTISVATISHNCDTVAKIQSSNTAANAARFVQFVGMASSLYN